VAKTVIDDAKPLQQGWVKSDLKFGVVVIPMNSHLSELSSIKQAAQPTLTMAIWMSPVEISTIADVG
jgi:hypothetical protein